MGRQHPDSNSPTAFGGLSRSELMSRIRSQGNASTEFAFISLLKKAGLKGWRRNSSLPGRPDFVWPILRIVVFVDGCFWHGHNCGKNNMQPKTNAKYWKEKIEGNRRRDRLVTGALRQKGYGVLRIWECEISKRPSHSIRRLKRMLTHRQQAKSFKPNTAQVIR